jgi:hypothetical protein
MVANRIDKRPKSIRLLQAPVSAQQCQHSHEGFLPDIFHGFFRVQSRAQFETDQFAKVAYEMPFDIRVSRAESFNVGRVERKEFQARFLHGD